MKIIALIIMIVFLQASFIYADHDGHDICEEIVTGEEFGLHIVEHADEMQLDGKMNPGIHHNGYSICVV